MPTLPDPNLDVERWWIDYAPELNAFVVVDLEGRHICTMFNTFNSAEINASKIAFVPEMLRILEQLVHGKELVDISLARAILEDIEEESK